jgi:hypothetical protein
VLPNLRSAREKLCVAQTDVEWPSHRRDLQQCLDSIDRIGVFLYPAEWSKYANPTTELD